MICTMIDALELWDIRCEINENEKKTEENENLLMIKVWKNLLWNK